MESQVLEVIGMLLLSLWKVYISFGYFAFESYNFIIAILIVGVAVSLSNLVSYYIYAKIKEKRWFTKVVESRRYVRARRFYQKYGFYLSMLLAPTILGIPTTTLVSLTMQVENKRILTGLLVSSLLWGALIYASFYHTFG